MKLPPIRRPGEKVYADDHNGLVRYVRGIASIRGGKGIVVTHTAAGVKISLKAQPEYRLDAVIDAVHAPGGAATPQDLSQVTYDVVVKGRPEFVVFTNMTPRYGRPDPGVDGMPAKVGDDCELRFRRRGNDPEVYLEVKSEYTVHVECAAPAQSATGAVLAALQAEIARVRAMVGNAGPDAEALVSSVLPPLMLGGVGRGGGGTVNG